MKEMLLLDNIGMIITIGGNNFGENDFIPDITSSIL